MHSGWLRAATVAGESISDRRAGSLEPGTITGANGDRRIFSRRFRPILPWFATRGSGQSSVKWSSAAVIEPRPYTQSVYSIPFSVSYEVDLFGRVRRNVEAANASLQSTAADLGNVQLVLTAELAADYFTLRELDAEYQVVEESVEYQRKALDLVNNDTGRDRERPGSCASRLPCWTQPFRKLPGAAIARAV